MNRDDIIKLAREADINVDGDVQGCPLRFICVENDLERFAALVAAAEREACAKLCDVVIPGDEYSTALINSYADDIRARGQG